MYHLHYAVSVTPEEIDSNELYSFSKKDEEEEVNEHAMYM